MNNISARQTALQIIYKINEDGAFSNVALEKELSKNLLKDRRDISLVTEIVNGTTKNKIYIDYVLQKFSKQELSKLSPWVRNILRISTYQLLFLDKIPESAAVNEGVNLTKKYSHQGSVKFVNGVLRNIIRKKDEIIFPDKEKQPVEYLNVNYSFPIWLVKHYIELYGFENTEKMLIFFNMVPDTWIRVNTLKATAEKLEQIFFEKGIILEKSEYVSEGYKVVGGYALKAMEEYKDGFFSIQDETSMFAVDILDPKPGENILDACSAPGGKTTFIAERMKNEGRLKALEFYEHRLETLKKYCQRNSLTIVDAQVGDARELHLKYGEEFDKVLADVPCSGLGVLGKRADLKFQADSCKFEEIRKLQMDILKSCAKILKTNGILVYSTCTLNDKENQDIINEFLMENKNFEKIEMPEKYQKFFDSDKNIQTLPFRDNKSGFFIAKMRKRGL